MIKKIETGFDFPKLKWTPPQTLQVLGLPSKVFGAFGGCSNPEGELREIEMSTALTKAGADIPPEWAEGCLMLCTMARPSDFIEGRWSRLISDATRFIADWAAQAARLDWSTLEVFGINRTGPDERFDGRGLVALLNGRKLISITKDEAKVSTLNEGVLTIRRQPTCLENEQALLWDIPAANDNAERNGEPDEPGAGQNP